MKKHLLIGASLLALGITTTAIYAQVTGTSVVDKMKAVAHSFTLAATLNPSDSGLTSDPLKGKKTGDILTAGEWNRMLELVSEGGAGSGTGWTDVSLGGTENFDDSCMYRYQITYSSGGREPYVPKETYYYVNGVSPAQLVWWLVTDSQNTTYHIAASSKNLLRINGTPYTTWGVNVTKIEKLCGGGGGSGGSASPTCPSGFVAIGSYCIEPTMSSTGKTWYEAAVACTDKGAQLCHWSEWSAACLKGKLTDVTFGASGKYEWIDDYSIGNQGIADPIVHSDCKYLSRQADTTAAANTGYRCCTSQK